MSGSKVTSRFSAEMGPKLRGPRRPGGLNRIKGPQIDANEHRLVEADLTDSSPSRELRRGPLPSVLSDYDHSGGFGGRCLRQREVDAGSNVGDVVRAWVQHHDAAAVRVHQSRRVGPTQIHRYPEQHFPATPVIRLDGGRGASVLYFRRFCRIIPVHALAR